MFFTWTMGRGFGGAKQGQAEQKAENGTALRGLRAMATVAGVATMTGVMTGCGAGVLSEGITGLSATAVALDAGQTYTFDSQVQGFAKVTWSISGTDCAATNCGVLSSTTGASVRYTAPATLSQTQNVVLTATLAGTQAPVSTATIALSPTLSLGAKSLPSTMQGASYSAALPITGGMAPFQWSVASGSLPNGMSLDAKSGLLSGTATTPGSYTFAVAVADASIIKGTAQANYTVTVLPTVAPLKFTSNMLPDVAVGASYSATVPVLGGTAPYTCSSTGGLLPAGLSLSGCTVSGTATAAGTANVTIKVMDSGAAAVMGGLTLRAIAPPLTITTVSLPPATLGLMYTASISASGGSGPYSCTVTSGSLPVGISLSNCTISGRMTSATGSSFTLQVKDASTPTNTASRTFSVRPGAPTLALAGTALPNGTVGVSYSGNIPATGGVSPYTCSVSGGALPSGLTLNGCSVRGTPSAAGAGSITVQVKDGQSPAATITGTMSWNIAAPGLSLATKSLPNGTVGTPYATTLSATGGVAPYRCALVTGVLPAGVVLNGCSLTGTPSAVSASSVGLQVSDAANPASSVTGTFALNVSPAKLTITTASLKPGATGSVYSMPIATSGGQGPYVCTVSSGALPVGLALNGCTVSGTPNKSGAGEVTIAVADAETPAQTASASLPWSVAGTKLSLITTQLPTKGAGSTYATNLNIAGGTAPYTCAMAGGALPSGLTLTGCTVTGRATQAGTGSAMFRVTDSAMEKATVSGTVQWTVNSSLALTASALPQTTVGKSYVVNLPIAGGRAPYQCSMTGGQMAKGLMLQGCTVMGTPTQSMTGTFHVQVVDSMAQSLNGDLGLVVKPEAATTSTLSLATTSLPNGTAAVFYSSTIQAAGGAAPYTCTLTGGTVPAGLSLNGCSVTGTPTGAANASLSVHVSDSSLPVQSANGTVSLAIAPAVLTLASANMPAGVAGQGYAGSMSAVGGTAPYRYRIVSGSLPAGLVLGADGVLSGSTHAAGTANFTAQVNDSSSPQMTASHAFSITVAAAALTVSTETLPAAMVGEAYSVNVDVSGGTAPYACSVVSGALPTGLSLSGCKIAGTPKTSGGVIVTVKATDAGAPVQAASGSLTLPVAGSPMTITTAALPNATKGAAYSTAINVAGATGAVSCGVTGGALPAGLQMAGGTCAITGMPTAAGAATVTVTATDSSTPNAHTATATLPLTVNGATLALSNAPLTNPVLGQAYNQALTVTGGQAPYTYAVSGGTLPRGLTLSASGVLSGTSTAAGGSSFVVTVTDSAATAETATQMFAPMVVYPAGANNGKLSGSYAFLVQGFDAAANGDLPYQTASVGSFVADGAGLVTGGEMDSNHQAPVAGAGSTVHLLGTYEVGANDRGLVTLTVMQADGSTGASTTYEIAAAAEVAADGSDTPAQVAARGGEPMLNTGAPGMLLAQDKTAFAQALQGNYVFGMRGDTPCLKTCGNGVSGGPAAAVGQFSANGSGQIATGTADSNIGTQNFAQEPLNGTYAAADGNGRVAVTLTTAGTPAGVYPNNYTGYVVDANQVLLMSSDNHATHVLLSGTAQLQQQGSFADNAMSGAYVGSAESTVDPVSLGVGLGDVSSSGTATIFRGTANGDGSCSVNNVDVAGGAKLTAAVQAAGNNGVGVAALLTARATTGAVSCRVGTQGRGVLTAATPLAAVSATLSSLGLDAIAGAPRVFYLSAPGRGYFLESGYAALGSFEPQAGAPFSNGTLQGTYDFGTGTASTGASDSASGVMQADGSGSLTLTADAGLDGSGQLTTASSQTGAYTFADAAAGRITANSVVLYVLSPDRLLRLDEGASVVSPTVGSVQR